MATLQAELQLYQTQLPQMLAEHDGEYVVIKGTKLAHFAESYERALDWAYDAYGLERFFVKKVSADEGVVHFTRDLGPCRS